MGAGVTSCYIKSFLCMDSGTTDEGRMDSGVAVEECSECVREVW